MKMRIKVCDFGIAGMFSHGREGDRSDAGSLFYIPPEILNKRDNSANPALDIWSMGVIFYGMLTGYLPFQGESRSDIARKITRCEYKKLSEYDYVAPPWNKVVSGMLRVNPKKRWTLL
jgi:serine/threonine protein kinase